MELKLRPNPVLCPYGFTINLYCKWDNPEHPFEEDQQTIYGRDRADVFRMVRESGWILHKDNTATCPKCRKFPKEKESTNG